MSQQPRVEAQSATAMSDDILFEEAARRLKRRFFRETGCEFRYGRFEFVFHDGRFQCIEEQYRSKGYLSPSRFKDRSPRADMASA